jgi:hypothetical protein
VSFRRGWAILAASISSMSLVAASLMKSSVFGAMPRAAFTPVFSAADSAKAAEVRAAAMVNARHVVFDDLDVINGKQDQLEGRLQQRYGYAKDEAKKEVNDWYGRQKW